MNKKEKKEIIQRTNFVLGIIVASIIGFVLNVYANIFYDAVVTGKEQFSNINSFSIALLFIILMYMIAFLQFLIYDYQNEINLDRSFFKRFSDYYDNIFWFSRLMNRINKFMGFVIKLFLFVLSAFVIVNLFGWPITILWIVFVFRKSIIKFSKQWHLSR
ncbi:MAG: hypothetical protein PHE29_07820 [Tissierellia bacterium]|nr:hypothetical protein [Tissierellia bacterium]